MITVLGRGADLRSDTPSRRAWRRAARYEHDCSLVEGGIAARFSARDSDHSGHAKSSVLYFIQTDSHRPKGSPMTLPPAEQTYRERDDEGALGQRGRHWNWPRAISSSARCGHGLDLSRRNRRWVTLTCVAAADAPQPIEEHVYAAVEEPGHQRSKRCSSSFCSSLSIAVGLKAAHCEGAVHRQWTRIAVEEGREV